MPQGINIGGIYADLDIDTGNLEQGLAKGRVALAAAEAEMKKLQSDFAAGAIDVATFTARMAELNQVTADLAPKMQAAYDKIGVGGNAFGVMNAGMNQVTASSGKFGQGLMQAGYFVDDLQFGLGAVVNNIGPLVAGLGGGAGVAGAVQILAVGANQLTRHWNDLLDSFGVGKVVTEAEQMAELGKQTRLTADEAERLARFKALGSKTADLRGAKTKSEKEAEDTATEAITEAGFKDVVSGVKASRGDVEGDPAVAAARKKYEDAKNEMVFVAGSMGGGRYVKAPNEEKMMEAEREIINAQEAYAEKFVSAATLMKFFGPEKLLEMVEKHPEWFGAHVGVLREGLELAVKQAAVSPEDRRDEKEAEAKAKAMKASEAIDKKFADEQAAADRKDAHGVKEVTDWEAQEDRKKEQEDRKFATDAQRKAHEAVPGFKQMAEFAAVKVETGEANLFDARKAMNAKLEAAGLTKEEAISASGEEFSDAKKRVNDRASGRAKGPGTGRQGEQEHESRSETYSTASLTQKIQSGVGDGGEAKKQTAFQEKMAANLEKLASQKALRIEVKK